MLPLMKTIVRFVRVTGDGSVAQHSHRVDAFLRREEHSFSVSQICSAAWIGSGTHWNQNIRECK